MTERLTTTGAAGSAPLPVPVSLDPSVPFRSHGSPQPPSDEDVSQVLLQRAAHSELAADGRDRGMIALDPAARRLARLLDPPARPPFDIPERPACHPTVAAAVACPDLFLVHAEAASRPRWLADAVDAATRGGQRVFVLTHHADQFVAAVRWRGFEAVARAVGPDESADQLSPAVSDRTASAWAQRERAAVRDRHLAQMREADAQLTAFDHTAKLDADCTAARAALERVAETAAARVDQSDAGKQLVADRDAARAKRAVHLEQIAAAERELAELRKQAQPGGLLKRLFGGPKPMDVQPKTDAAEARARELTAATPPDPDPAFHEARQRLIDAQVATLRVELAAESDRLHAERAARPVSAEPPDVWRSRLTQAEAALAELDTRPVVLSADGREAVRVVVGPLSAVGHDPLATPSHPETTPPFDRVFCAEADALADDEFVTAARLGQSWVLLGTVDVGHPPAYRNGVSNGQLVAKAPTAFAAWWETLHDAAWTSEGNRLLARLTPVAGEQRHRMTCEPLLGQSEIEVRFVEADGPPELAEVLFPHGVSVVAAKALLAAEAGECRFQTIGSAHWHESADGVMCCWPVVELAGLPTATVDLGDGVCERVACDGPAALTAAVTFAASAGWTRESAADWLSARTQPTARTAVVG